MDIGYTIFDTEIGTLFAAFSRRGISALQFFCDEGTHTEQLRRRFKCGVVYDASLTRTVFRFLRNYLMGNHPICSWDVDLYGLSPFDKRILSVVRNIPYGSVASYSDVASAAGVPKAARAVGNVMRRNPIVIIIPCHRVIRADGSLGGFGGGIGLKERLLHIEGVSLSDGCIDLQKFRWRFQPAYGH